MVVTIGQVTSVVELILTNKEEKYREPLDDQWRAKSRVMFALMGEWVYRECDFCCGYFDGGQ
jgi:hypothetical protein